MAKKVNEIPRFRSMLKGEGQKNEFIYLSYLKTTMSIH